MLETSFTAQYPVIQTCGCFWSGLNYDQFYAYFDSGIISQQSTKITVLRQFLILNNIVLYSNMLLNQMLRKIFSMR